MGADQSSPNNNAGYQPAPSGSPPQQPGMPYPPPQPTHAANAYPGGNPYGPGPGGVSPNQPQHPQQPQQNYSPYPPGVVQQQQSSGNYPPQPQQQQGAPYPPQGNPYPPQMQHHHHHHHHHQHQQNPYPPQNNNFAQHQHHHHQFQHQFNGSSTNSLNNSMSLSHIPPRAPGVQACANPRGCPCDACLGAFCSPGCASGDVPCSVRIHAAPQQPQQQQQVPQGPSRPPTDVPCARRKCECSSPDGLPTSFCCDTCRNGQRCSVFTHGVLGAPQQQMQQQQAPPQQQPQQQQQAPAAAVANPLQPTPITRIPCVTPGCCCVVPNVGGVCSYKCKTSGPCQFMQHYPGAPCGTPCVNSAQGCPCDSFDGKPSSPCGRQCGGGKPCTSRHHTSLPMQLIPILQQCAAQDKAKNDQIRAGQAQPDSFLPPSLQQQAQQQQQQQAQQAQYHQQQQQAPPPPPQQQAPPPPQRVGPRCATPNCPCDASQGFQHCCRRCAGGVPCTSATHTNFAPGAGGFPTANYQQQQQQGGGAAPAAAAGALCQRCNKNPANPGFPLCTTCHKSNFGATLASRAQSKTQVVDLPRNDRKFQSLEQQFSASWHKMTGGTAPRVNAVLALMPAKALVEKYDRKKKAMAAFPNEMRLWHGTGVACTDLYSKHQLCSNTSCATCQVAQVGFLLKFAGSGLYSKQHCGLYFSDRNAKSHQYNSGSEHTVGGKKLRCMFACRVLCGKEDVLTATNGNLTCPSSGCDSVTGKHNPKCDEHIVYSEDQGIPGYIVIYEV